MNIEESIDNYLGHTIFWFGQISIDSERVLGQSTPVFSPGNENKTWSLSNQNDTWTITVHSI